MTVEPRLGPGVLKAAVQVHHHMKRKVARSSRKGL